jgi:hypothetical protein
MNRQVIPTTVVVLYGAKGKGMGDEFLISDLLLSYRLLLLPARLKFKYLEQGK